MTRAEYWAAVREIDALLDANAQPGTPAGDRLVALSDVVEAYDEEHEPDYPDGQHPW